MIVDRCKSPEKVEMEAWQGRREGGRESRTSRSDRFAGLAGRFRISKVKLQRGSDAVGERKVGFCRCFWGWRAYDGRFA